MASHTHTHTHTPHSLMVSSMEYFLMLTSEMHRDSWTPVLLLCFTKILQLNQHQVHSITPPHYHTIHHHTIACTITSAHHRTSITHTITITITLSHHTPSHRHTLHHPPSHYHNIPSHHHITLPYHHTITTLHQHFIIQSLDYPTITL